MEKMNEPSGSQKIFGIAFLLFGLFVWFLGGAISGEVGLGEVTYLVVIIVLGAFFFKGGERLPRQISDWIVSPVGIKAALTVGALAIVTPAAGPLSFLTGSVAIYSLLGWAASVSRKN